VGANHLEVLFRDCYFGSCAGGDPTDTFGLTYNKVIPGSCSANLAGPSFDILDIFWALTGSHSGTDVITLGGGRFVWAAEYSSSAPLLSSPFDAANCSDGGSGGGTLATSGNVVTTASGDLFVTFAYCCSAITTTSNVTYYGADMAAGFVSGDFLLGAAGTYASTTTIPSGQAWIQASAAFKPPGGSSVAPTPRPWIINMAGKKNGHSHRIPWDDRRHRQRLNVTKA